MADHGVPKHIVTDRGTNFMSNEARGFYKRLGIIKHTTTSFHPQSDGCCERLNGTLVRSLKNLVYSEREDWDRLIHFALLAHRNAKHASTGESPAYLVCGRDLTVPHDILTGVRKPSYGSINDYADDLQFRLKKTYETVSKNLEKAQETQQLQQHKHAKLPVIKEGDLVYLFTPYLPQGQSKKLTTMNRGPFKVIKKTSEVNFLIRHVMNPKNEQLVHINRLTLLPKRRKELQSRAQKSPQASSSTDSVQQKNQRTISTRVTNPVNRNSKGNYQSNQSSNNQLPRGHNTTYYLRSRR